MIENLQRAQSNTQPKTENNTEPHNGSNNQQRFNNNRTIALEWTVAGELKCILQVPKLPLILFCCGVVLDAWSKHRDHDSVDVVVIVGGVGDVICGVILLVSD